MSECTRCSVQPPETYDFSHWFTGLLCDHLSKRTHPSISGQIRACWKFLLHKCYLYFGLFTLNTFYINNQEEMLHCFKLTSRCPKLSVITWVSIWILAICWYQEAAALHFTWPNRSFHILSSAYNNRPAPLPLCKDWANCNQISW